MADDKRLERMEASLDKIAGSQVEIQVTLAKQQVILEEHVRRTEALEALVKANEEKADTRLKPIEKRDAIVGAFLKILMLVAGGGGIHGILHYLVKLY